MSKRTRVAKPDPTRNKSRREEPDNPTFSHPPKQEYPGSQYPTPEDRPNPCSPKTPEHDCKCHKPGSPSRPEKPKRPKARPDSCCEQLIELLRGVKGLNIPEPHKPKQSPERKVQALCNALGISDAILPALAFLWKRHLNGDPGRNEFEEKVRKIFAGIGSKEQKDMDAAMDGYLKLRAGGKAECLFNDCLVTAGTEGPIDRKWFAEVMLGEGLQLAGQIAFPGSKGIMGPGGLRLWDNIVSRGPNGSGATIYQGPWPWLTAIGPDVSGYEEYGNLESFRPVPGGAHVWQNYQYSQTCTYTPATDGSITANCEREHPPPPPPPSPGFPGPLTGYTCPGGKNYTKGNDCLRIPAQRPGGSVKLKGFNFITPTVKVHLRHTTDASVVYETECIVWGDQETPLKDATDHFIVDERVRDWVDFPLPSAHPTIPGAPLPAGIYEITVIVANVGNVIYDSATPPLLVTNALLIRLEPDPNIKYLLWSDTGRCNRETPGMGDDEIWWDAFTGHLVPNSIPVPAVGASGLKLQNLDRRSFPREPWEDMDDGESAGAYRTDVWGPAAFELYGVAVVAIVGFEVDSEAAARDQLQGFWNAWGEALTDVVNVAVTGEGIATGILGIAVKAGIIAAKLALTIALIALAVIAAITLIATALWAAWAPADLIALDIFHLDALSAWDATDPKVPLPATQNRQFGDPEDDDNIVSVTEYPLPKIFTPGDAAATWVQGNLYETPDDGEDASYTVEFRLARS